MIEGTTDMMNQDQQNFNASWQNYSEHLRAMLKHMSSDDFFADVTLITEHESPQKYSQCLQFSF